MFRPKTSRYHIVIVGFVFALMVLSGCDQISNFLGEYFPSLKKTEQAQKPASQAPVAPAQERPALSVEELAPTDRPLAPNTLARVGDWTLTIEEFNERLKNLKEIIPDSDRFDPNDPETKKIILEELVRQQLLVQDAERSGFANQEDIVAAVNEFRRSIIVREMAGRIMEGVEATDQDVREYYEQNKDVFVQPLELRVREIVVPTQKEANDILVELLKGADFAQMAKDHSRAESAANGGDLGFIAEAPFPAMAGQLAVMEEGGLSSVFKGPEGFYIIKLEESRGGGAIPLEDIYDDLKEGLTVVKQQEALTARIEEIQKQIPVKMNEALLEQGKTRQP